MKKRIVSCILIVALVLASFGGAGVGAEEKKPLKGMDYIVKRLTIFSHEDRANLETIFIPLLITDTGLDALVDVVEDYTPESQSMMHIMLKKLLDRVEKEEVIKTLSYLYMIDEKVREDYIGGYYERKELELSTKGQESMNALMEAFFSKYPELKVVFEQDGITGGVIARVLKMFSAVNNNIPLFKKTLKGQIAINYMSPELKSKIEVCLVKSGLPYTSAEEMLKKVCGDLNASYSGAYMNSFIILGEETGLVLTNAGTNTDAGGPGSSGDNNRELAEVKIDFNSASNLLSVSGKDKNGSVVYSGEYSLFAVSFECTAKGYLTDPDGIPVRLCAYENGIWYAFLTKLGTYTVTGSADKYFQDVNGWGKDYINALYERKIISGRGEGVFAPDDKITREEFVKLIVELFDLKGDFGEYFTDAKKGAWYYEYVSAAKFYDIVDGYPDGSFGVGKNITRQDMCKVLYSVMKQMGIDTASGGGITLEFADRSLIADYAYPSVMALKKAGIVSGDDRGRFNPSDNATRQEAAKLIYNILLNYVKY